MDRRAIEISWASLWKIFFFAILVWIMFLARQIFLGLFLAIVISSGLEFVVTFLERLRIPRTIGVIIVFLVSVLLLIILAYLILPLFVIDAKAILSGFNNRAASYWLDPLLNFNPNNSNSINLFLRRFSGELFAENSSPLSFLSDVLGGVGLAISIFVSAFYLSLSRDGVERFIRIVIPDDYEEHFLKVYKNSRKKIGTWFRSQILLSITMAALTWVALYFLDVRHGFVIAILAGIFELVPFVGPILSGALAFLAALLTSPVLAFTTLIVFIIIHQFEAHVLVPLFSRRSIGVHPVVVIMALLIGLHLEGILGALVAVPSAAVIQEIVEAWSSRRRPAYNQEVELT